MVLTAECVIPALSITGLHALRRKLGELNSPSDSEMAGCVVISLNDFLQAMKEVRPSAMREVAVDVPKVSNPCGVREICELPFMIILHVGFTPTF